MATYFGLYYPFIHFRDEGWLKLAALYWDGIRRIVPKGVEVHDSDEVKRLIDSNFIQNKDPEQAAFQIMRPFRELINTHSDAMRQQFHVDGRDRWPYDAHTRLYAPGRDFRLAYVFGEKVHPQLLSDLFSHGLVESRSDDPRWIGMHPRLAEIYMLSLAEAMAPRIGAYPLTDSARDHIAVSGLTMERLASVLLHRPELAVPTSVNAEGGREVEEAMVSLAFKCVVPVNPASIPAEKIIDIRHRYAEERGMLQAEIARLAEGLAYLKDVKDPREVEQHLRSEYDKTLGPRLERLQKGLHDVNIDTAESAAAVSIAMPSAVAAILSAVGFPIGSSAGRIAGIAFAVWTVLRKRKKAVDSTLKPSPEAYLYRVNQLSPQTVAQDIRATAADF